MSQYCDSSVLEKNWFDWLLASAVPLLDPYRVTGSLWTKVIGVITDDDGKPLKKNGKTFPDATYHKRLHCIVTDSLHYFESTNGEVINPNSLPQVANLRTCLDRYDTISDIKYIEQLVAEGYTRESTRDESWKLMLEHINRICFGISINFNLPTEEERMDLANEALLQVMSKLNRGRLVYTPGRAPVFNLLTTTIHRCMYSIMNRRKSQRNGMQKLIEDVRTGSVPVSHRSLRLHTEKRQSRSIRSS